MAQITYIDENDALQTIHVLTVKDKTLEASEVADELASNGCKILRVVI